MQFDSRLNAILATASLVGLLMALTAGGSASVAGAQQLPNCTVAQNIQGIIDDSGSMSGNDPDNYRADLLEAIAFFNQGKTMGATLFGSDASALFGPFPIGPNFGTIRSTLATVDSNAGGTDYDAAFSVANAQNPNANARIFLSDGQPNFDPDPNLWRSPAIKSYVVGFGTADFTILNQIASETGGPAPFSIENASQLRTVSQIINAAINCEPAPILRERRFSSPGQTKTIGFKPSGRSAEVLISWPTIGNVFKALFGKQKVKVQSVRGESFVALNLKKLEKGEKLNLKIRAKKLIDPETVTAAIIR
jgi:von Willebrand factor type A domain